MIRVQIPAYTDRWMMGDSYGEVIKGKTRKVLDPKSSVILTVKLDKSGKTVKVFEYDCTYI